MNPDVISYIKARIAPKIYLPGEIVYNQDDPADTVCYLDSGCALAYAILPDGKEKNVSFNWSGQFIGQAAFNENDTNRAYVIADQRSSISYYKRPVLYDCMQTFPSMKDEIIVNLSRDIGQLLEKVADSALPSTEVRIARFICRRMAKGQCEYRGAFPALNFTQDCIADVVGVSRSAVSDALTYFKRCGWISTGYGHITILAKGEQQHYDNGNAT